MRHIGSNGELDWEVPGVTVTVINMGATVMCDYIYSTVNYSLFNSTTVLTGRTNLSLDLWF